MASLSCAGLGWNVDGRWILRDASITFPPQTLTAIVGMNGSGKTTLLRLLAGLVSASAGEVALDGRDIRLWRRRDVARTLAFMEQLPTARVDLTVAEVVGLGRIPHEGRWRQERHSSAVGEALALTGLESLAERRWNTLSGGERQRTQLARALAQEPSILLLDEPTNHLDLAHQISLLRLVKSLDCTVVVVLHDLDLAAAYADRLVVLQEGRVAACGPTQDVFTSELVAARFGIRGVIGHEERTTFSWRGLVDD